VNPKLAADKAELRRRLLAFRRRLEPAELAASGRSIRDAVLDLPETQMAGTVAGYWSIGAEPDTHGLLFALWKRGTYVLLPVLLPDGDLDWASYEGPDSLRPGLRGLMEPAEAVRGVSAVSSADLVLVPALAVDRSGLRLGRGGGSYDRALARVGAQVPTVALLYDPELVPVVPAGPHDQRVRMVARPAAGVTRLLPE
jgi:5-formyltetrahydrofolate cyclo-ligase